MYLNTLSFNETLLFTFIHYWQPIVEYKLLKGIWKLFFFFLNNFLIIQLKQSQFIQIYYNDNECKSIQLIQFRRTRSFLQKIFNELSVIQELSSETSKNIQSQKLSFQNLETNSTEEQKADEQYFEYYSNRENICSEADDSTNIQMSTNFQKKFIKFIEEKFCQKK
eukprot:TRINITY_DN2865_c0_g1_i1.p1 TRINITY_DN2865_c0_g1~~TRINITY_DN2865_c0_g1_i1.p1  ORF type:complete len:166 (-),score=17.98 TRINITY_DN2865_c0_g1_i1:53-550(-)